jgi:hypothetical protein
VEQWAQCGRVDRLGTLCPSGAVGHSVAQWHVPVAQWSTVWRSGMSQWRSGAQCAVACPPVSKWRSGIVGHTVALYMAQWHSGAYCGTVLGAVEQSVAQWCSGTQCGVVGQSGAVAQWCSGALRVAQCLVAAAHIRVTYCIKGQSFAVWRSVHY